MGKLEGKVAVITGGSSGMALASAKRFVEEGAYVFITGRRQEQLDHAVKLIGRNVTAVRGDAANLNDLDRLFATVKLEKGKIDILFASAGKGEALPLGEITEQHFDAAFNLNVRGTLFTVQKALPLFNDGGSILMTGSNASAKGFPGFSVYAASKLALRYFARTWLNELKGRNIRVNLLVPGAIATPMQEDVLTTEAKQYFESLIPRGTMGQSEEVASVALFLASNDSSFVNGVELFVDGGMTAIEPRPFSVSARLPNALTEIKEDVKTHTHLLATATNERRSFLPVVQQQESLHECGIRTGASPLIPSKLDLLQGTLDLMVLQTLTSMGSLHGYGIARRIEQVSGDEILLNQGTIYAALIRLQQRAWITAEWGTSDSNRKAKFYSITRAGRKQLAADTAYWQRLASVMSRVLAMSQEGEI